MTEKMEVDMVAVEAAIKQSETLAKVNIFNQKYKIKHLECWGNYGSVGGASGS